MRRTRILIGTLLSAQCLVLATAPASGRPEPLAAAAHGGAGHSSGPRETEFIRELAKNKSPILIIASGPMAMASAQALQQAILRNGELSKDHRKNNDIVVATLPEASAKLGDKDWGNATVVLFLAQKELKEGDLPPGVAGLLPESPEVLRKGPSLVKAAFNNAKAGESVLTITLSAPDEERLGRLYSIFLARHASRYTDLPFEQRFLTNRVAIFSTPELRGMCGEWGRIPGPNVWNDVQWYPLDGRDKLAPEQLEGRTEAYFFDRSAAGAPASAAVPPAVATFLNSQHIGPTTILVARAGAPLANSPAADSSAPAGDTATANPAPDSAASDGRSMVVFTAPNAQFLQRRLVRFKNLETVQGISRQEVADLRVIGSTALRVNGDAAGLTDAQKEAIRLGLARELRESAGIVVQERGGILATLKQEITTQELTGSTQTTKMLSDKIGARYLWVFTVMEVSGNTSYEPRSRKITPEPSGFSDPEPTQPSESKGLFQGKKPKDQYDREMADYNTAKRNWDSRKSSYDSDANYNVPVEWEVSADQVSSARARGVLQLFDLQGGAGKVCWEKEGVFTASDRKEYQKASRSVRGHKSTPQGIDTPAATSNCAPILLQQAALQAGHEAVVLLKEEALLPSREAINLASNAVAGASSTGDSGSGGDSPEHATPASASGDSFAQIADIDGGVVTLNAGTQKGLRTGMILLIPLEKKTITDPATGKVLKTKILRSISLKVTHADAGSAECALVSQADLDKLKSLRTGQEVERAPDTGTTSGTSQAGRKSK